MNATLLRTLVLALLVSLLLVWSAVSFARQQTAWLGVQLLGAACLGMVVLTHICEAFRLFPTMQWGAPHSVGHYLDFTSALLGFTLFPVGLLLHHVTTRHTA